MGMQRLWAVRPADQVALEAAYAFQAFLTSTWRRTEWPQRNLLD